MRFTFPIPARLVTRLARRAGTIAPVLVAALAVTLGAMSIQPAAGQAVGNDVLGAADQLGLEVRQGKLDELVFVLAADRFATGAVQMGLHR